VKLDVIPALLALNVSGGDIQGEKAMRAMLEWLGIQPEILSQPQGDA
jgi:hypothetical protein